MKKLYLSTALPYVNSPPHAGFALEIIQADVVARYHRILGDDVFFLTGTDENSLKNVRAAEKEGISTRKLVDRNAKKFYNLKYILNLSFNDFIRTTEKRHVEGAQKLWRACQKDIYKKKYQGLYCVGCEAFYKESELINGLCPEHKTKLELVEEENYFFKLSKYQNKIKEIIENEEVKIIPQTRKNEVLSFINQGLEDICVSRLAERAHNWGIDVPGDPSQKIWVWLDALGNYITALGYTREDEKFKKFWQKNENILHIIGKGILRFHAVYWLGFLLSAGLNLPRTIFVHGYITSAGQKMSKSLGNVVDPFEISKKYDSDIIRYFLLREISPFEDGDFSERRLRERYNSDLAQGIGNLVSRVLALGEQYGKQIMVQCSNSDLITKSWSGYREQMEEFRFNDALATIWNLISYCDKYISDTKPWEKINDENEFQKILGALICLLGNISLMLSPVMPKTSEGILKSLKLQNISKEDWLSQKVLLKKQPPLFPKKVS